jgi:hypothetical protein
MKKRHTLASQSLFLLSPGRGATSDLSSINFKRLRDPLGLHKNGVFVEIVLSRQQWISTTTGEICKGSSASFSDL